MNSSLNNRPVTKLDVGERFGMNNSEASARGYVYKQNPEVQLFPSVGKKDVKLTLAINTNQFGRTFQDR